MSGRFTFPGVYAGSYAVTASNILRPVEAVASGTLTTNGQVITADLVLKDTFGSISGRVLLPTALPPAPTSG